MRYSRLHRNLAEALYPGTPFYLPQHLRRRISGSGLVITFALLLILTPMVLNGMYRLQYLAQTLRALDDKRHLHTAARQQLNIVADVADGLVGSAAVVNQNWQITALTRATPSTVTTIPTADYFRLTSQVSNAHGSVTAHALYRRNLDPAVQILRFVQ